MTLTFVIVLLFYKTKTANNLLKGNLSYIYLREMCPIICQTCGESVFGFSQEMYIYFWFHVTTMTDLMLNSVTFYGHLVVVVVCLTKWFPSCCHHTELPLLRESGSEDVMWRSQELPGHRHTFHCVRWHQQTVCELSKHCYIKDSLF